MSSMYINVTFWIMSCDNSVLSMDLIIRGSMLRSNPSFVRQYLHPVNITVWYGSNDFLICTCWQAFLRSIINTFVESISHNFSMQISTSAVNVSNYLLSSWWSITDCTFFFFVCIMAIWDKSPWDKPSSILRYGSSQP